MKPQVLIFGKDVYITDNYGTYRHYDADIRVKVNEDEMTQDYQMHTMGDVLIAAGLTGGRWRDGDPTE